MRRIGALAWVIVCLALPAQAVADTPSYTPIGPPATLNSIEFAANGTVYGTVAGLFNDEPASNSTRWRSTDRGHTWSARFRAPSGSQLVVLGVSPADASTVYVSLVVQRHGTELARIDAATGRAVPFPFWRFLGADAAGTAYGLTSHTTGPPPALPAYGIVRCPRNADACSEVPATADAFHAVIDPLSVGVLAMLTQAAAGEQVQTSADGGATWAPGALAAPGSCYCPLAFAGPFPRTLYSVAPTGLSVSYDAGLTWAATRPSPAGDGPIVGSRPAVALSNNESPPRLDNLSFTGDGGATYTTVPLPAPAAVIGVDPGDVSHLFLADASGTRQSWDAGRATTDLADARFGIRALIPGNTAGAGSDIYSALGDTVFSSSDLGATWTRLQRSGMRPFGLHVSRDDPRSAYVLTQDTRQESRTRDGGNHWDPISNPLAAQISVLVPGSADHVLGDSSESLDGGLTWAPLPPGCALRAVDDATSATGKRIACATFAADGSVTSTSPVTPLAQGVSGSPDVPGALAVAAGKLLGDVGADGTWTSLLEPTDIFGPAPPDAQALAAWPARGGTTFYGTDYASGVTWVRRGPGRWWRLQESGHDLGLVSVLDSTHAVVSLPALRGFFTGGSQPVPLGVIDLARPAVDPPRVEQQSGALTCVVPWSRADADTSAYAWLRDGAVLRGAVGLQYRPTALDRGRDLTCRATATTSWGSVTLASSLPYVIPGARVDPPRPLLTGAALAGSRLVCGARAQISWLRDGRTVPGRHARTYLVQPLDRGHGIACQARLADGTVVQSRTSLISGPAAA
jgi:hypothetical protein